MASKTLLLALALAWVATALPGQNYERYKKLADTTFASKHLGFDKKITITVPVEWQKELDRSFPLIVVFDRQNQRSHQYILNTIDYLTSNEQMPSAVIVSIESAQEYRALETLHKISNAKGLLTENEKFLFEELIPVLENQYHASGFRVFIGHSRYGYFTSSLLFSHINDLNAVISLSPFFSQKNVSLVDSMANLNKRALNSRKYYRFGIGNDYPADFAQMDSVLKTLHNPLLDAKGVCFAQAGHNATPGLTIGPALYDVFEDWSNIQSRYISNEQQDITVIDALDKEILSVYGQRLRFSLGTLNGKGWYFYNEGQYAMAIAAWEVLMKNYPNFSEGYLYIIEAQAQLKQDCSETIKRFNASLAESDFYSESAKEALRQELGNMNK